MVFMVLNLPVETLARLEPKNRCKKDLHTARSSRWAPYTLTMVNAATVPLFIFRP